VWWVDWWVEEPQKHRAPWIGALLSYMAEEVCGELEFIDVHQTLQ